MKKALTFWLIFCCLRLSAQDVFDSTKLSPGLMSIVNKVATTTWIGSAAAGFAGRPSENYPVQEELRSRGTMRDFRELTNHPSKVVRYIAYTKMSKADSFDFMPGILQSISRSEYIGWSSGCFQGTTNFTDFLFDLFKNRISSAQFRVIDSTLIFGYTEKYYVKLREQGYQPINAEEFTVKYLDKLLIRLLPDERYYPRLKQLLELEDNPILVYTISKFHRPGDSSVIINALAAKPYFDLLNHLSQQFWCCKAIYDHPDNCYLRHLERVWKDLSDPERRMTAEECYIYVLALSQYKNPETYNLLSELVRQDKKINGFAVNPFIWLALKDKQDDYFKSLSDNMVVSEAYKKWMPDFLSKFNNYFKPGF